MSFIFRVARPVIFAGNGVFCSRRRHCRTDARERNGIVMLSPARNDTAEKQGGDNLEKSTCSPWRVIPKTDAEIGTERPTAHTPRLGKPPEDVQRFAAMDRTANWTKAFAAGTAGRESYPASDAICAAADTPFPARRAAAVLPPPP